MARTASGVRTGDADVVPPYGGGEMRRPGRAPQNRRSGMPALPREPLRIVEGGKRPLDVALEFASAVAGALRLAQLSLYVVQVALDRMVVHHPHRDDGV